MRRDSNQHGSGLSNFEIPNNIIKKFSFVVLVYKMRLKGYINNVFKKE